MNKNSKIIARRGEIFYVNLEKGIGSEQGGIRPVVIIQNETGNIYSPTVIIAAITSQQHKKNIPTHVNINSEEYGLNKDSVILLEQIRTIDKSRLKEKIGRLSKNDLEEINKALLISLGLHK